MWLFAAAAAHPLGSVPASEALVLRVSRERVEVSTLADVPRELLAARANGRDPLDDLAVELEVGLSLDVDGVRTPLVRQGLTTDPVRSEHTVGIGLELAAPLAPGPHALVLRTTNLADARVVRSADVWVTTDLRVLAASTLVERDGVVVRDDGGRWKGALDEVSVRYAPEPAGWARFVGRGGDRIRARLAPRGLARFAELDPVVFGVLALALVAGRALGSVPVGQRVGAAAVGLALAAGGVPDLALGAAVLGLLPWPGLALAAGGAAVIATTRALGPGLVLGVAWTLPGPSGDRLRAGAGLLAAAVLLRAVAGH